MDQPIVIEFGDATSSPGEAEAGRRRGSWRRRVGVFIAVLAVLVVGGATPGGYPLDRSGSSAQSTMWSATLG